ncbi:general transcriptional corepressor trfA-like [Melitaea cinxia]|uniref:general transcriptional corepressor trfA-like n=1 Tax=Melitaea cinxia TaxID=113334 RepID=UPI001E2730D3|nr:general transcriptional corepressor trfA-like [Melitaea cinxia]
MMAGPKFFVYGGCRWREVDTTSGNVVGWGNVQFLALHQGRLEVARKTSVLRGLRSLAAGKPTTVHVGSPLSQIRRKNVIENKKEDDVQLQQHHCCCKQHNQCYNSNAIFNNLLKAATTTAAVQCSLTELNACIEPNSQTNGTLINISQNQVKKLVTKRRRSSDDEVRLPNKNLKSTKSRNVESDSDIDRSLLDRKHANRIEKALRKTSSKRNRHGNEKSRRSSTSSTSDDEDIPKLRKSQRLNLENRISEVTRLGEFLRDTPRTVKNYNKSKIGSIYSSGDENFEREKDRSPRKNSANHTDKQLTQRKETRNSLNNKVAYLNNNKNSEIHKALRKTKRKLSDIEDSQDRKVRKTKKNNSKKQTEESEREDLCKELLISEEDIVLLRTFIENDEKNIFNVDLEQFDTDDRYKGLVFYKLNPLVNIERCKEIAKMLRQRPTNTVTFEDFISNLGLRSVLDTSSQASSKYKMRPRKSIIASQKDTQKHSSESEPDKENYKRPLRNAAISQNKILVEHTRNEVKSTVTSKVSSNPVLKDDEVVSLSSDTDNVFKKSVRRESRPKATMLKRNNEDSSRERRRSRGDNKTSRSSRKSNSKEEKRQSAGENKKPSGGDNKRPSREEIKSKIEDKKRPSGETKRTEESKGDNKRSIGKEVKKPIRVSGKGSGREYTRAEDEALVRWVAGSMRAKRVNGNQLWRELQTQYQQMTGHFRSWHSLRNRYLRYLLPALHRLDLPPPEAARLRAAAATGELKSRKKPQRRNSILAEPRVRSAWTQRAPRKSSPSPSPSPAPPPSRSRSLPANTTTSSDSSTSSQDFLNDRRSTLRRSIRTSIRTANNEEAKKPARQLRSSIQPQNTSPPTYSELTKRYADKQTPPKTQADTQIDTKRTRRLYNHAM